MADPATPPADPATPPPADPATPPAPPSDPPTPTDPPADDGKGGKDAILADLAKERDKRQALEQTVTEMQTAHQQQMERLAKAFGLAPEDDAPPDPAALAEQVSAEQARAREAALHLAVFQNAGEGDPKRLLNSVDFRSSIAEIDPADTEKIAAAVAAAIEADPLLKAAQPSTTPPFPGGPRTPAPSSAGSMGEAIANKIAAQRR